MNNVRFVAFAAMILVISVFGSGCADSPDVSSVFNTLPQVQEFFDEHPDANVEIVYWSADEVESILPELSEQFGKPVIPKAMYKATISEDSFEVVAWIDARTHIVLYTATVGRDTVDTDSIVVGTEFVDVDVKFVDDDVDVSGSELGDSIDFIVGQPSNAPQVSVRVERSEYDDDYWVLSHQGGDVLYLSDVRMVLYYKGSVSCDVFDPVCTDGHWFSPGDEMWISPYSIRLSSWLLNGNVSLKYLPERSDSDVIQLIDIPSEQFIAEITVD